MRKIAIAGLVVCALCTGPANAQRLPSLGGLVRDVVDAADAASAETTASPAAAGELSNSWRSSTRSRFHHTIEAAPGRVRLRIEARTTAGGGETVAVYPSDHGDRGGVRIMFVIATTRGHTANGYATVPRPASGEQLGQLPIVVDVENAGGRRHQGDYCITVHPAD